ncbi:quinoprotein relay system zinc metallohydrolase 1 [Terasakiella sp. SH-1]|uniref:quinoprotein relay system zinc metallohydrolase 1 n=1 Tax=Terasakiella sp. SH-1 TaxID=2560057 RepID=UPI0010733F48|nr:quinoprotein relay system zinc metallohydrolase 1 [Terasakiella sp. SH-1]
MKFLGALIALFLYSQTGLAKELTYNLTPIEVAKDVYFFMGEKQYFSRENGGNIVNTGFIIGTDSVIVIDSGPSLRYGNEMKRAIGKITPKPVRHLILTHHHPDHFFGNSAFDGADIYALPETLQAMKTEGDGLLENMFHMVGDWMMDTEIKLPNKTVNVSKASMAGRNLRFIPLQGHTVGDLAILDEQTGTLFAGDLAFYERTATTPHAHLHDWYASLDILMDIPFKTVVPGHGPIDRDGRSLRQTLDYLQWLETVLKNAAQNGLEMTEAMRLDIPDRFQQLALHRDEFQRSVSHLWAGIMKETLPLLPSELD